MTLKEKEFFSNNIRITFEIHKISLLVQAIFIGLNIYLSKVTKTIQNFSLETIHYLNEYKS